VCIDAAYRRELLRDGWKAVGKVFLMAMAMDVVYPIIAFRRFYPGEALLTSFLLALLPYALLRGPINRILRHGVSGGSAPHATPRR
jgi:hypothetical protein